eukprot:3324639-Pleurochrysis_carterae.AAC.1
MRFYMHMFSSARMFCSPVTAHVIPQRTLCLRRMHLIICAAPPTLHITVATRIPVRLLTLPDNLCSPYC